MAEGGAGSGRQANARPEATSRLHYLRLTPLRALNLMPASSRARSIFETLVERVGAPGGRGVAMIEAALFALALALMLWPREGHSRDS
jgi:hypothetical protein